MDQSSKALAVTGEIRLFDIPFFLETRFQEQDGEKSVRFTVRVGDKTLGEVLRYIVGMVNGPTVRLDAPWNVIDGIRLDQFAFEIEFGSKQSKYGFSYSDIGLDLTFLQVEKLEIFYVRPGSGQGNSSVDVNIYGTFLGIDFTKKPIGWDALKEAPPSTPGAGDKVFRLEYLGLGQRVTLRDIKDLETIGQVMDALSKSYEPLDGDTTDPLAKLPSLTYQDDAAWLVGAQFSILEAFDFSGLWNLPRLAGARIGLRGERVKSLAGFEFEILYRRIADDLGQYHFELVLPDVLRRFQAGTASVTLPIIALDIYTDGGFLIDLGFPRNLDFTRAFSIEMLIYGVPVVGGIGVYFGVLSGSAVPAIPEVTGGSFKPVIVVGVGFRIGVGKSIVAGILDAGLFVGIEALIEGILGFYEPLEESEPKGIFFRVGGTLQLTGHIWGEVNFAIVKAKVDFYAYVGVSATFEAYRATIVVFSAGVSLKLTVTVGFGIFSFDVKLSFEATVSADIPIGDDLPTPWRLASGTGTTLAERVGPVAYRRLPTGDVIADEHFAALLEPTAQLTRRPLRRLAEEERVPLALHFHPVTTLGVAGDKPGATAAVRLVAVLMARLSREEGESLAPAEAFVSAALDWGLARVGHQLRALGADLPEDTVTLSELRFLYDDLVSEHPLFPIDKAALHEFFYEYVATELVSAEGLTEQTVVTPFPMIPFLSLETSNGHKANFETEPMCSPEYQAYITRYFEELDQGPRRGAGSAIRAAEVETWSMTGLIFVDSFRIVLRSVAIAAIDRLRRLEEPAAGADLRTIAERTGLDSPAGMRRLAVANAENEAYFAPNSPVQIVARGVSLPVGGGFGGLAERLGVTRLVAAQSLRTQPVLKAGATLRVAGGRYTLQPSDTKASITRTFGIPEWSQVEEANPFFDWTVPPPVDRESPYPTLELPAGETINLPPIDHAIGEGDTLQKVSAFYCAPLFTLVAEDNEVPLGDEGMAYRCASLYTLEGESLSQLSARAGLPDVAALVPAVSHLADVLSDAPLSVPQGRHVIARGETLQELAKRLQTTPDAIVAVNDGQDPANSWKFIPRPFEDSALPLGVEIVLPEVPAYRPTSGETFASVAARFGLSVDTLIDHNAGIRLVPLVEVILPPLTVTQGEPPRSPEALAKPFALSPEELVLANQGARAGQGSDVLLGTVIVPDCEKIARERLTGLLAEGGTGSSLGQIASSMARFLLAGLRLPDPEALGATLQADAEPRPDEELFSLYSLAGQQWDAPAQPTEQDWVQLSWNDSDEATRFITATCRVATQPPDVRVTLGVLDVQLINAFREALADPAGIQPKLLAVAPYPALEQVPVEQVLGAPTAWARPTPLSFVVDETDEGQGQREIYLHAIPRGLREMLPAVSQPARRLDVQESFYDAATGEAVKHPLTNTGWATRLDFQIGRVWAESADEPMPASYELLSAGAQTQADLLGLRAYLRERGGVAVDLSLLYPADPLSSVADTLRSDEIVDRKRVVLVKSNLSTVSRPPTSLASLRTAETVLAAATFDDPRAFLELLWQVSVTNAGGFYLGYDVPEDDPGLPDSIFSNGGTATISVLVVLRPGETQPDTVEGRRFHNVLITAENLVSSDSTLNVAAVRHTVTADPEQPQITQTLEAIAGIYGIGTGELGLLNASTPNLINVGAVVQNPRTEPEPPSYAVLPGDDLLTVALVFGVTVEALAQSVGARNDVLHAGATMEVYPEWVAARNRVEADLGGFRILRKVPPEVSRDPAQLDAHARIERLFNLMGYGVRETAQYHASTQGLPIPPADPDERARNGFYCMPEGEEQPWVYARLLPIARWSRDSAVPGIEAPDPYAGLGTDAPVEIDFQDVFGNRLPRPGDPVTIDWQQRYRDPLLPVHAWPSVTLAFDVTIRPDHHAPALVTRIKFAPSSYVGTPGTAYALQRKRFAADRVMFARAYYQVVDQRVKATLTTTLRKEYEEILSTERLARFAGDAFAYLGALDQLAPVRHDVSSDDTLDSIAGSYRLTVPELAAHIAADAEALETDRLIDIPHSLTVLPNTSIDDILALFDDPAVTAEDIGRWNAGVLLTAELRLFVGESTVETKSGDTLGKLATGPTTAGEIAAANATVKALFLEGAELDLGTSEIKINERDTLASIAHQNRLRLERLADANRKKPILRKGALLEIPAHLSIPEGTPCTTEIGEGESFEELAQRAGSIRDLATANTNTTELLVAGQTMYYPSGGRGGGGERISVEVAEEDTLYTITRRFAVAVGDPSLKPADVVSYPDNATNRQLLRPTALVMTPPARIVVDLSVPADATRDITIVPLETVLHLRRTEPAEIDPAFAGSADVTHVSSVVPPRLSSEFSPDDRATLRAFAREFQSVFDHLRLASGADAITSAAALRAAESGKAEESKLVVVQWDHKVLEATVRGPACFFAPEPLLTRLWHASDVEIYPYVPGQPLDSGEPTPTNFSGVDLERWAQSLLRRIDRLLLPDMALSLRALEPSVFQKLIDAKRDLAEAIVKRVGLVLPVEPGPDVPVPDPSSAREQLLQQLLVELSETYRGGIVVQYQADVTAPAGWAPTTAPRLLCGVEPTYVRIPEDDATLDALAAIFDAEALLVAGLLRDTENILDAGKTVPVGARPVIQQQDTIASIVEKAEVTIEELVDAVHDRPDFLAPGAGVPLAERGYTAAADDTFASVLEHLAPNLTARGLLERAVEILDALNGAARGVFVPGVTLTREVDGTKYSHTTEADDSMRTVADALHATVFELVDEFYVTAPLIRKDADFRYLALYPPSTISSTKIALYQGGEPRSKLNAVYVTTAPDEASSVSLRLGYAVQAMEYNVREVGGPNGAMGYQASDWLTFIDWKHGQDLEDVQIPIPNRQFPVPPAILSHDTIPRAVDGKVDPERLDEIPRYDYLLSFAFDSSPQDEMFYTQRFNVAPTVARNNGVAEPGTALPGSLAQFAAIDTALWEDLEPLSTVQEAGLPADKREIVINAARIFADLAARIAGDWDAWNPPLPETGGRRYRIRRHHHPGGRSSVTVAAAGAGGSGAPTGRALPSARLIGRASERRSHPEVQVTEHAAATPVPRTRRGEKYEVRDPDLTVLAEQNCWGLISVTRNEHLVQGCRTEDAFVLQIDDVRAIQPATPAITIDQRLDVAHGLRSLGERIAALLRALLFPGDTPPRSRQLSSVTASFARHLVEGSAGAAGEPQPADASTLFAPVVTTPALPIEAGGEGVEIDPEKVAAQLADYLDGYLRARGLAPLADWSLTLRLFSEIENDETGALLLEILDLRVPMESRK